MYHELRKPGTRFQHQRLFQPRIFKARVIAGCFRAAGDFLQGQSGKTESGSPQNARRKRSAIIVEEAIAPRSFMDDNDSRVITITGFSPASHSAVRVGHASLEAAPLGAIQAALLTLHAALFAPELTLFSPRQRDSGRRIDISVFGILRCAKVRQRDPGPRSRQRNVSDIRRRCIRTRVHIICVRVIARTGADPARLHLVHGRRRRDRGHTADRLICCRRRFCRSGQRVVMRRPDAGQHVAQPERPRRALVILCRFAIRRRQTALVDIRPGLFIAGLAAFGGRTDDFHICFHMSSRTGLRLTLRHCKGARRHSRGPRRALLRAGLRLRSGDQKQPSGRNCTGHGHSHRPPGLRDVWLGSAGMRW